MIEIIIAAGFSFVLGMLVGHRFGIMVGAKHLALYMRTVSEMHNVVRGVHEKHGIVEEIDDALLKHGIVIKKINHNEEGA